MTKDFLQKELDKNKFLFVKYAFLINLLILAIIIYLLFILEIANESIFVLFIKFYIH